ncbi:MAG: hypothetical protein AAF467_24985 [Actinomycetota bacterium]
MLVPLIVAALAAVAFLVLWIMGRQSAAAAQAEADEREKALSSQVRDLTGRADGLDRDLSTLTSTHENLQADHAQITAARAEVTADRDRLTSELAATEATVEEQAGRLESQSEQIEILRARVEEAEKKAAAVLARDTGVVIGDQHAVDTEGSPSTLWDLELARSERTWRTSVAINPARDESPFTDAADPVRLAVEIEASALRENVGAAVVVDWAASPVEDPARAHLVVRVAQELLEAAARNHEPTRLVARDTDDSEVNLRLEAMGDGDEVINFIPPQITSDLVDIRDGAGVSITVKTSS